MTTQQPLRVLVLAGSYRSGSFNQALIKAAVELAPDNVEISEFDLRTVPFYDGDLEEAGLPQPVVDLKAAVTAADAVLWVTPEYNAGVPAVLKNGLDWSSRIYPDAPLGGKLGAVIGATPGKSGTSNAQESLRKSLSIAGSELIPAELMLARAGDAIEDDVVTSSTVKDEIRAVLDAIVTAVAVAQNDVGEPSES